MFKALTEAEARRLRAGRDKFESVRLRQSHIRHRVSVSVYEQLHAAQIRVNMRKLNGGYSLKNQVQILRKRLELKVFNDFVVAKQRVAARKLALGLMSSKNILGEFDLLIKSGQLDFGQAINLMQTQQFGQMQNRNCSETFQHQFFKVSNETGKLKTTPIFERPLLTSYLDTYNSFILDLEHQIYVWIGNNSNVEERNNALIIGQSFVKAFKKPKNTMVSIIQEDGENVHFMSFFDKSSKN